MAPLAEDKPVIRVAAAETGKLTAVLQIWKDC